MSDPRDVAFLELLTSYDRALDLADRMRQMACAVIDAHVAGG
jgi:hypothetical protein